MTRWYVVKVQAEHQTPDGWSGSRQVPPFHLDASALGIVDEEHAARVARDVVSAGGLFEDRATFHVTVANAHNSPVLATVDDAIDLVIDELGIGSERDTDLIGLVRNAIHARSENPEATFDDVVNDHYDRSSDAIRADWDHWS